MARASGSVSETWPSGGCLDDSLPAGTFDEAESEFRTPRDLTKVISTTALLENLSGSFQNSARHVVRGCKAERPRNSQGFAAEFQLRAESSALNIEFKA
jgi:hypothetical protein